MKGKWTLMRGTLQDPLQLYHSKCSAFKYWCETPALRCVQWSTSLKVWALWKQITCSFLTWNFVGLSFCLTIQKCSRWFDCCFWSPSPRFVSFQLEQLYSLSLCSREDCLRILSRHQWNLQQASRYLIRWSRDDRSGASERERPPLSTERRVWVILNTRMVDFFSSFFTCFTLTLDAARHTMGRDGRSSAYENRKMKMVECT